jgi:hypothetical protein
MITDAMVHDFGDLFRGRDDVYGAVWGQCVQQHVSHDLWRAHLEGETSVGIYPLVGNHVWWGCTDIDRGYEASWPLARNIQKALHSLGITSWIERTKSKGFHVWTFAKAAVEAEWMRNALLVAHQIAGVPPTEVNPKQLTGVYGNYVNVPYAGEYVNLGKRVIVDERGEPMEFVNFLTLAMRSLTAPSIYQQAASLYVPPKKKHVHLTCDEAPQLDYTITSRLSGLAWTILREGPLEGRDRSGTLMRLAHLCVESDLNPDETLAVISDADARWGKFTARGALHELEKIVERAHETA